MSINSSGVEVDKQLFFLNIKEILNLMSSVEKLLSYLEKPPTVITVARSSHDDYCPPFQVKTGIFDKSLLFFF